jgi:hypothetical protein
MIDHLHQIDLCLAAWRRLVAHLEGRRLDRPDVAQEVSENAVAAGVAEIAQLAVQTAPGQSRKRRKPLAQIARERRDLTRPRGSRPRSMYLCASCGRAPPGERSTTRSHPADAIPGSSRSPQVRPMTRPSAWKDIIIGFLPPTACHRLLSAHLGSERTTTDRIHRGVGGISQRRCRHRPGRSGGCSQPCPRKRRRSASGRRRPCRRGQD